MLRNKYFKRFFESLAERKNKENDLSDITYSLCNASPQFKRLFLEFFFKEIEGIEDKKLSEYKLLREYSRDNSRVDFYFEVEKKEYIIEIKINNDNDHVEQYKKDFRGTRFGWIANYIKGQINGVETRTWRDFFDYL